MREVAFCVTVALTRGRSHGLHNLHFQLLVGELGSVNARAIGSFVRSSSYTNIVLESNGTM
jgi:hypothetical protein